MLIFLSAETAEAAGEAMFPPFNPAYWESQAFWLVVSFLVLYLVLSNVILPKVAGTLERRSSRIASDLDEAARLNDEATAAQQALELEMAKARTAARETAAKAQTRIDNQLSAATAEADAEIEQKLAAADATISEMREEAMSNVEGIAAGAAKAMAEHLGATVTAAQAKKAVKAALKAQ